MSESTSEETTPAAATAQLTLVPDSEPAAPETEAPAVETPDEPSELDQAHEEFLRERGITASEEPAADPDAPKPVSPEVLAEAQRLVSEQKQAETRQQQTAAQTQAYNTAQQSIYDALLADNIPIPRANQYLATIKSYMDLVVPVSQQEASAAESLRTVQAFYTEIAKNLPKAEAEKFIAARGDEHKSPADTVKATFDLARKGYIKESDVKSREAKAVTDYKAFLESKGLLVGGKAPVMTDGTPAPNARMTLKQIEDIPTAQWLARPREERERLLNNARRTG